VAGEAGCWCDHLPNVSLAVNASGDCFCPSCLRLAIEKLSRAQDFTGANSFAGADVSSFSSLVEGEDYYLEGEGIVFTGGHHLRRGYCCQSGCRHCPFGFDKLPPPAA